MIKNIVSRYSLSNAKRLFLFAGQGTQEVGMLNSIPESQKKNGLDLASKLLNLDLHEIVSTDEKKQINQTEITQPLLLLSHYLHFKKQNYHENVSQDDWMIGHSLGQYSALVNAGSLALQEGLRLVHLRGSLMKKYTTIPHGMLIVKFKSEKQEDIYAQIQKAGLEVACINTKTNIIVAGQTTKIQNLSKILRTHQAAALSLPVSTAFHCKMLQSMKDQLCEALSKTQFNPPKCKIIRNYDCQPYNNQNDIREGLLLQLTNPVRFQQSVDKVPQEAQIIEVGNKRWISKFADEVRRQSFLESLI